MTDAPLTAIRKILIEDQGVPAAKVTPDARFLHDLGVDGDDAAEVFDALHERLGTDFTELTRQWRLFFNTEGASRKAILFGIPAILVSGGAASVLAAVLHLPKPVGVIVALALFIGGSWFFSRWFGRDLRPLTVGGLAEIILSGRWPVDPADVR